jgi:hypothetical protein
MIVTKIENFWNVKNNRFLITPEIPSGISQRFKKITDGDFFD